MSEQISGNADQGTAVTPTNAPRSTSAPIFTLTYGAVIPPMQWCGVHHAHGPHIFTGKSGLYISCPGSACGCADA